MAAASTDKLRKWSRKWVGQIGAAGVSDASTTTVALSSTTNLPTDTGVTLVIDRVDSAGTLTPSLEETIVGVVSGSNMVTCVRGVEGTAQAHSAGAVVELLVTATEHNDLVDVLLVGHDQAGAHKASLAFTSPTLTTPQINDTSSDHQYIVAPSELSADRTITLPLLTADDTMVFRNHSNIAVKFNYPRGYLVNGKIVPSVASNNLTVAIKGLDGNDPSATNPVYCRIGDTIQSITSALSVTKNAGTNWFDSGSAGLATKEVDYFVYLGYNATDGVVVGFSRIPYAGEYANFSATSTNETYCAISTITNAASGDDYELVGRFAATLSAGAGYTWSVPAFTNNNLMQRPIFETRWLSYSPVFAGIGGGTAPVWSATNAVYKRDYDSVTVMTDSSGDGGTDGSGANDLSVSMPVGLSTSNGTGYPLGPISWFGTATSAGCGICQRYSATVIQLRSNPTSTITCATFPAGNRWLYIKADYLAI